MKQLIKKAILSVMAFFCLLILTIAASSSTASLKAAEAAATITPTKPSVGDGKSGSPYKIGTAEELYWFAGLVNGTLTDGTAKNKSACAELTDNIDLSGICSATAGSWKPIGDYSFNQSKYSGNFNGKNYKITGLYINSTNNYQGLIGYASNAVIQDVTVKDSTIQGAENTGGIVGYGYGGSMTNCHNEGSVKGTMSCGGIAGVVNQMTIDACSNRGQIIGTQEKVGGIAGEFIYATLSRCFNTGEVQGRNRIGGIIGNITDGKKSISDCYNQGIVIGANAHTGGIAGWMNQITIKNCYNVGQVSGGSTCGSIVGYFGSGTITNCFYESTYLTKDGVVKESVGGIDGKDVEAQAEKRTTAIFTSGEIAYLLNGKKSDESVIWYQKVSGSTKDNYPNLSSSSGIVYCDIDEAGKPQYSNSQVCEHGHTLVHYNKADATCTDEGHIEYWFCTVCRKYFSDAAATIQITTKDIFFPKLPHTIERVEALEYTEETGGYIAHYRCTRCGKLFSDEDATNELTKEQIKIKVKVEWDGNISYYADIQEAFDEIEAKASHLEATVTLLRDIVQESDKSIIIVRNHNDNKYSRNIVLDMNGHTISKEGNKDIPIIYSDDIQGTLTLKIKGNGSIIGKGCSCLVFRHSLVTIMDNVVLDSDNEPVVKGNSTSGELEVRDHSLVRSGSSTGVVYGYGTLTVNGGTLINSGNHRIWNEDTVLIPGAYGSITTVINKGILIGKDDNNEKDVNRLLNRVYGSGNILSVDASLGILSISPDADLTIAKGVTLTGNIHNYGVIHYGNGYGKVTGQVSNYHKLTPVVTDAAKGSISVISGGEEVIVDENKITYAKTGDAVKFTVTSLDHYIECGNASVKDSNGNTIEAVIPQKSQEIPGNSNTYCFTMPDAPVTITASFKVSNTISAKNGGISWNYTPTEKKSISTVKGEDINWEGEGTASIAAYYIDDQGTKKKTTDLYGGASEEGGVPHNAGTYYVKVKVSADDTYAETTSDYLPLTIHKAENSIHNKEQAQGGYATTYVYTSAAIPEPEADLSQFQLLGSDGTMKLQWYQDTNSNGTVEGLAKLNTAPVEAGSYSLMITIAEDKNYNDVTMVLQIDIKYEVRVSYIDKEGNMFSNSPATTDLCIRDYSITLVACEKEGYQFLGWYERTGETPYYTGDPLSENLIYSLTVGRNKSLVAVYDIKAGKQCEVIFESYYGQVIESTQLNAEDEIILPAGPSRYGYLFKEWSMKEDDIRNQIKEGATTITVSPVYDLDNTSFSIIVNQGSGGGTYKVNEVVTVKAKKSEEGKKFIYWKDEESAKIVSYLTTHQFYAIENCSLTACYDTIDTKVTAGGIAEIKKIKVDSSASSISFVTMHTVPKGPIKYAGIIATSDAGVGMSGEGFNKDTAKYVRGKEWSGNLYRFTWTKKKVKEDETWYVRAYLVYTDADSNEITVYSDMKMAKLNDESK